MSYRIVEINEDSELRKQYNLRYAVEDDTVKVGYFCRRIDAATFLAALLDIEKGLLIKFN